MSQLTDKVEEAILDKINDLGLELEYTELVKEGENNIYRIVIDKSYGNISVDDCELLSRSIEDIVDKFVNVNGGYILEVSSAGLERKLVNLNLYKKYIGNNVRIKLFKKIDDLKEINGKLIDVIDNNIVIKTGDNDVNIDIKNIAHANTVYDFDNN